MSGVPSLLRNTQDMSPVRIFLDQVPHILVSPFEEPITLVLAPPLAPNPTADFIYLRWQEMVGLSSF